MGEYEFLFYSKERKRERENGHTRKWISIYVISGLNSMYLLADREKCERIKFNGLANVNSM